jgi:hypothetical protein
LNPCQAHHHEREEESDSWKEAISSEQKKPLSTASFSKPTYDHAIAHALPVENQYNFEIMAACP